MTTRYIRVGSHPHEDMARGHSYEMGGFGDEECAHAGLSGYEAWNTEALEERMGFGSYTDRETGEEIEMFVALFEGRHVGMGPDSEDLFRPLRLVAVIRTTEIADAAALDAWVESQA